jgi:AcrR family transcriptional regulator
MPRRAKVRPDEPGREKVLGAARTVFGERGFEATTIADIGARAEISKSVLYHYFGSKAGLYEAVLEHDAEATIAAVARAVPPPDDLETPRLHPGIDAFLHFLSDHPDTWRLMVRDPPADQDLRRLHERIDQRVGDTLRSLLAPPAKRTTRPDLVDLIALAVRTYAAWWRQHPEVPRAEVVEAIGDLAATSAQRIGQRV